MVVKLNESFSFCVEHKCAGVLFFTSINTYTSAQHLSNMKQDKSQLG